MTLLERRDVVGVVYTHATHPLGLKFVIRELNIVVTIHETDALVADYAVVKSVSDEHKNGIGIVRTIGGMNGLPVRLTECALYDSPRPP